MSDQIILAWKVLVAGTSFGPLGAAAALAAVPLYANPTTDPVLGQNFGLTVATDATTHDATSATRTLTLNMTSVPGAPFAPPPFPCHPDTSTPPVLPYVLRKTVTLAGFFLVATGSLVVGTSATQLPAVNPGDVIELASQLGVFYTIAPLGVTATTLTLTAPYTGTSADGTAVKIQAAPATIAALYSSSSQDSAPIDFEPLELPFPGARSVSLSYTDSLGAAGTVVTTLSGKFPAQVVLAGGTIDIATITDMHIVATGGFKNSIGQITLAELSAVPPPIPDPEDPTVGTAAFYALQDQAQLLIPRPLAYLPPSYFALAQQGAGSPQLPGDFLVTTGSTSVPTTADQTAALAPGNVIQFASQLADDTPFGKSDVFYTVAAATASPGGIGGLVTLTTPYTGLDRTSAYDSDNAPRPSNVTAEANKQPTGAVLISPSPAAPPTNAQLAAPMAQFVNPGNAVPPPNPPLPPGAMSPSPTMLSGMFAQTIALALAVPVAPQAIALA